MLIKSAIEKGESWSGLVVAGATTEIMALEGRPRMRLKFRKIGNYLSPVAGWGFCYWQILQNGIVVQIVRDQIGYAAQRELITPIIVHGGDRISVNGVNPTLVNENMGVTFTWDEEAIE